MEPRSRPSAEEGSDDSSFVKDRVLVSQDPLSEGPTAVMTSQELVVLHERLRGGEKGDNLDTNSGSIFNPGTVPHLLMAYPAGLP